MTRCDCDTTPFANHAPDCAVVRARKRWPRVECPECEGDGQDVGPDGNLIGGECEECGGNGDLPRDEDE